MRTAAVHLPDVFAGQIIAHCRSALPNEGCGLIAMDGAAVVAVYPTSNEDRSPHSFTIPPREHFEALSDAEARGWRIGGVFHSHPQGPARMSPIDVERALEPDWVYVVVSLSGDEPEITITAL